MNRALHLHPISLALGLIFGVICLFSMGQTTVTPTPLGSIVRVEYMPHPRDIVQIGGLSPYTVPPGKLFVLTGVGTTYGSNASLSFRVDGQRVVSTMGGSTTFFQSSVAPMPLGFTAPAGSTVDVVDPQGQLSPGYVAWGYLAPQ